MTKKISKAILLVEAYILAIVSVIVLMLFIHETKSILDGNINAGSYISAGSLLISLVFILAGCSLLLSFFTVSVEDARSKGKLPWYLATAGAAISIFSFIYMLLMSSGVLPISEYMLGVAILSYGCIFVIPFLHLSAECWLRK